MRRAVYVRRARMLLVWAALALAAGSVGAGAADAAPGAELPVVVSVKDRSGTPAAYFLLHAAPGRTTAAGRLQVRNAGRSPVQIRLDRVDGATANTLGSVYATPGSRIHGATRWLVLGTRSLTIPADSTREVPIAVSVPRSALPGDYLSGISVFVRNQTPMTAAGHGMGIASWYRYAVGVETLIPGARRPHLAFTGARVVREPFSVVFLLLAHNDGNVILKNVTGEATISRGARIVGTVPIGPGTFVTHTAIELPVRALREQPRAGTVYRVRATLDYEGRVARLDTQVTFGRGAARVQQQYLVRPTPASAAHASSGTPGWLVGLLGATAAALLGLLGWLAAALARRRRALRSAPAIEMQLISELAADGPPPSIIGLAGAGGSLAERRTFARALREQLRAADVIGDLGEDRVLIVLPRASADYAETIAGTLAGAYPAPDGRPAPVAAITAEPGDDARRLIERARERLAQQTSDARVPA